jgi:LPS-assembly lipoprotein
LAWLAPALLPAIAGCGFAPRRPPSLPFRSLALTGFAAGSPVETRLRRALQDLVALRAAPAEADVVLHAEDDRRTRTVAASTAAGQVRELTLRTELVVRADTPGGRLLIAPLTLRQTRDLSYNETAALAKSEEEATLFAEMENDMVAQLLRRLAAIDF